MGAALGEPGAKSTEKQHKVTISKGFYMGIHDVTQEQYLRVMGKNPMVRANYSGILDHVLVSFSIRIVPTADSHILRWGSVTCVRHPR